MAGPAIPLEGKDLVQDTTSLAIPPATRLDCYAIDCARLQSHLPIVSKVVCCAVEILPNGTARVPGVRGRNLPLQLLADHCPDFDLDSLPLDQKVRL